MAKTVIADNFLPLVELDLEQLNHEKALIKIQVHKKGSQLRHLQKEVGDLNKRYDEIDKEMLSRDERYEQEMLKLKAESDE